MLKLNTPDKEEYLQQNDKRELIGILQQTALIDDQKHPLSRAIGRYIQSFRSALLGDQTLMVVSFEG